MARRAVLISALGLGPIFVVGSAGAAGPPHAAVAVRVAVGSVATGIDASLAQGGVITGTVTNASTGHRNRLVEITAFNTAGEVLQTAQSQDGVYSVSVPAGPKVTVCVSGIVAELVGQCWKGRVWDRGAPPADATPITVSAGQSTDHVDFAMARPGVIKGVVRGRGKRLSTFEVVVENRSTGETDQGFFGPPVGQQSTGHYSIRAPGVSSRGFSVCFAPARGVTPHVKGGYLRQCWKNTSVLGHTTRRATAVRVAPGETRTGIDADLGVGGAIDGMITGFKGAPVSGAQVDVFTGHGHKAKTTRTNVDGLYHVNGVPRARADHVCVESVRGYFGRIHGIGSQPTCYGAKSWSGAAIPRHAVDVRVRSRHTTRNINFALTGAPVGRLEGFISGADHSAALEGANVVLYTAHGKTPVESTATDHFGDYHFKALPLSAKGYRVCVKAYAPDDDDQAATGYSAACSGAAWDGGGAPPASATMYPVTNNSLGYVDVVLPVGGAIAGTVDTSAANPAGLRFVATAFDSDGFAVSAIGVDSETGQYQIYGLPDGVYRVCFAATYRRSTRGNLSFAYTPECYDDQAWSGR